MAVTVGQPTCLPVLRRWLRDHIPVGQLCSDAQIVCTELVSNAFDHADGPRSVRILVEAHSVQIEVDDTGTDDPLTPGRSRLGSYRGRGLAMVTAVSDWGVCRRASGKTVWATVSAA